MLRQRLISISREVLSSGNIVPQPIRCYAAPAVASDESECGNVSMNVLPSRNLIKTHVRGVRNRRTGKDWRIWWQKLSYSVISSAWIFTATRFDDGNWSIFYIMIDPEERSSFLIFLFQEARSQESGQSVPEGKLKISEISTSTTWMLAR